MELIVSYCFSDQFERKKVPMVSAMIVVSLRIFLACQHICTNVRGDVSAATCYWHAAGFRLSRHTLPMSSFELASSSACRLVVTTIVIWQELHNYIFTVCDIEHFLLACILNESFDSSGLVRMYLHWLFSLGRKSLKKQHFSIFLQGTLLTHVWHLLITFLLAFLTVVTLWLFILLFPIAIIWLISINENDFGIFLVERRPVGRHQQFTHSSSSGTLNSTIPYHTLGLWMVTSKIHTIKAFISFFSMAFHVTSV